MDHRRFARGPMLHRELKEAHATAMVRLRAVDADLEELLAHRRACLDELEGLRCRVDRRYGTRHGGRRRPLVDEPPVPPTPPDALPLHGTDLRAVAIRLLRRHGPHRLRDLHGLLHCYGYSVAGPRPVKDLAEAMRYETNRGRARRIERGVYEADPHCDEDVPYPRWLGEPPEDRLPLPWSTPITAPGPPLVDPLVAEDPALWAGEGYPEDGGDGPTQPDLGGPPGGGAPSPPEPSVAPPDPTADTAGTPPGRTTAPAQDRTPAAGSAPAPPSSNVGSDSVTNRTPRSDDESCGSGPRSVPPLQMGRRGGPDPGSAATGSVDPPVADRTDGDPPVDPTAPAPDEPP